ncbi:DUF1850 domain-containing protein [Shewanella sp. A25]|nr:DUF1850 domain-containing protein [Shewanella shenzhenensis]
MLGLCLGLAGSLWAFVPTDNFTLAWQHTIEKIRWEEDYRLSSKGLVLTEARVKGTGAGMEIPDNAVFSDGSWHYQPTLPILPKLTLGRTPEAGDYDLCLKGHAKMSKCQPLSHWIGLPDKQHSKIEFWPCNELK